MARKKVIKCACCEEKIDDETIEMENFLYGTEGTKYDGKIVCEGCYYEDYPDPQATIIFSEDFEEFDAGDQLHITNCRNDTRGEFTANGFLLTLGEDIIR
jgi:hypothetical protein